MQRIEAVHRGLHVYEGKCLLQGSALFRQRLRLLASLLRALAPIQNPAEHRQVAAATLRCVADGVPDRLLQHVAWPALPKQCIAVRFDADLGAGPQFPAPPFSGTLLPKQSLL